MKKDDASGFEAGLVWNTRCIFYFNEGIPLKDCLDVLLDAWCIWGLTLLLARWQHVKIGFGLDSYVCCVRRRFEEMERAATSGGNEKEDVSDIVAEENRKRKRKLEKKEKEKATEKGKRYKDSFKF